MPTVKNNDEFVSQLKQIQADLIGNEARFTRAIDKDLQELISKASKGEELTVAAKTRLWNGLDAWYHARHRNHNIARGLLHTAAVLLTGPLFHIAYAIGRWVKNTFFYKYTNDFSISSDASKDFAQEMFASSIGKAHQDLEKVKAFLDASQEFSTSNSVSDSNDVSEDESWCADELFENDFSNVLWAEESIGDNSLFTIQRVLESKSNGIIIIGSAAAVVERLIKEGQPKVEVIEEEEKEDKKGFAFSDSKSSRFVFMQIDDKEQEEKCSAKLS